MLLAKIVGFGQILSSARPEFALCGQLLDDGFDDQVAIFQVFEVRGAAQTAADLIAIGGAESSLLDQAGEIFVDAGQTFVEKLLRNFAHRYLAACLRGDLRDA